MVVDVEISIQGLDLYADILLLVACGAVTPASATVDACEGDVLAMLIGEQTRALIQRI